MYDHHRPVYHLMPMSNWMNDPNGLIQYNGVYHVFYQHNPHGALWGNMSWGHARSIDLVHWEHLPIAIRQDPHGPDADGCFSGAIVVNDGVPTMVYTGVRKPNETCCLAFPDNGDLVTWTKYDGNPVIPTPPPDVDTVIFRDHTLWREHNSWMMGIGSGIPGQGGTVLVYRSADLKTWEYLHPLIIEQPELNTTGEIVSTGWECPDYFFIGDEPVLLACEWDGDPISSSWWRGEYRDQHFHATSKGMTDCGDCLYAPQTFLAEDGRRLFFGWMRELRSDDDQVAAGWSGVMSLPREVSIRDDGTVAFRPAAEVRQLRGDARSYSLRQGKIETSDACEILVSSQEVPSEPVALSWGDSFSISWTGEHLLVRAGERESVASIEGDPLDRFEIDIFIDHSLVEIYLSDRVVLSTRDYGSANFWSELDLCSPASVDIQCWQIESIW